MNIGPHPFSRWCFFENGLLYDFRFISFFHFFRVNVISVFLNYLYVRSSKILTSYISSWKCCYRLHIICSTTLWKLCIGLKIFVALTLLIVFFSVNNFNFFNSLAMDSIINNIIWITLTPYAHYLHLQKRKLLHDFKGLNTEKQ